MKKMIDRVGICLLIAAFFWCGTLISDRQRLNRELIRLHIVAASDGAEDQARKLRVRDAVTQSLQSDLQKLTDAEQARAYLQEKLPDIQQVASRTLQSLGCQDSVRVSLCKEAFDTRVYDTFPCPPGCIRLCGSSSERERDTTGGAWCFRGCAFRRHRRALRIRQREPGSRMA